MINPIVHFWNMYDEFKDASYVDKLNFPFPMAVFGTLRKLPRPHVNNYLMGSRAKNGFNNKYFSYGYRFHTKAFVPHFLPCGLWLDFREGSSGAFELFIYNKRNWKLMIGGVDSLEGFRKGRHHDGGYQRTLVKVYLLPKDFESEYYSFESEYYSYSNRLYNERDLRISLGKRDDFKCVPAWIYSNHTTNIECMSKVKEDNPILWTPDVKGS